ncbi:MAG: M67 family metallopeptidase, partial [Elusimicrobia bacterium]|nr:M67 family metallopeptidase [Elusimicrobiota bacterium]
MRLLLPAAALEAVRARAAKAFPEECCGLLVGPVPDGFGSPDADLLAVEARPLDNAWEGGERVRRFRFDGLALARAERELEARGWGVLGIYHSHPDAPAWPSPFDLEHA